MMRAHDPGWSLVASHDPTGRRGLWMRGNAAEGIDLCAGRDGDDVYIALRPGDVVTGETLSNLYCALLSLGDPPDGVMP